MLELDEETTIAKISRGFDKVGANDELTLKIASKSLSNLLAHKLLNQLSGIVSREAKSLRLCRF